MSLDIYKKQPLKTENDIMFFSKTTEYTENYEKISSDHLTNLENTGKNPFMEENLWKELEKSTLELIKEFGKKEGRILDVGVGLGRLLSQTDILEKYGMDISTGYLEESKKKGINVCYSLIEDMPYKDETFDIIVCTDVLEHVLDLNLCLTKILSVLKKDGILIIRVPYKEDLTPYLAKDIPYKFIHLRNFDEASLKILFEKIFNCKVIKYRKAGFYFTELRVNCQIPFLRKQIYTILRVIRYGLNKIYKKIEPNFINEVDINFVVKKT